MFRLKTPHHRKLLGESIREIGVLVLVFVPLDMILQSEPQAVQRGAVIQQASLLPPWITMYITQDHFVETFFTILGIILLFFGIKIEGKCDLELKEQGGNQ